MSEWIDVKDEPPKIGDRVLVFYWCAEDYTETTVGEYMGESVGFVLDDDNQELCIVTHWMPLPEPPRTQKEG